MNIKGISLLLCLVLERDIGLAVPIYAGLYCNFETRLHLMESFQVEEEILSGIGGFKKNCQYIKSSIFIYSTMMRGYDNC